MKALSILVIALWLCSCATDKTDQSDFSPCDTGLEVQTSNYRFDEGFLFEADQCLNKAGTHRIHNYRFTLTQATKVMIKIVAEVRPYVPDGADANLYLDGKIVSEWPKDSGHGIVTLSPGTYTIKVETLADSTYITSYSIRVYNFGHP